MKTQADVLLAAQRAAGSYYQVAKRLGVQYQKVSAWRRGKAPIPEWAQIELAEIIGCEPAVIAAIVAARRARSDKMSQSWARTLERLAASSALILAGLLLMPPPTHAAGVEATSYTLRAIRRRPSS